MSWFNYYGLGIMAVIMIPNIIYAVKHKNFENKFKNKPFEVFEQIGRCACMVLMIFNIPYTYFNFWFNGAFAVYFAVNGVLLIAYCVFWIILFYKSGLLKALSLSIIPSAIFIFSGIMLLNVPLIVFAVLFAVCHIFLSVKNVVSLNEEN